MLDFLTQSIMKENQPGKLGKVLFSVLFFIWVVSAVVNIKRGHVNHPAAFGVAIIGLFLFLVAKISAIRKKRISFGTGNMSEGMANLYRLGYWLMVIGALITFT